MAKVASSLHVFRTAGVQGVIGIIYVLEAVRAGRSCGWAVASVGSAAFDLPSRCPQALTPDQRRQSLVPVRQHSAGPHGCRCLSDKPTMIMQQGFHFDKDVISGFLQHHLCLFSTSNFEEVLPQVTRVSPLGGTIVLRGLQILNPMGSSAGSACGGERLCRELWVVRLRC
jgi:hypothetical protein